MAGFSSLREIVQSELDGKSRTFTFRKAPSQVTRTRQWFDLSMSPGNPVPQYYASSPLVGVPMKQSDQGGIFHGAAVSPSVNCVRQLNLQAAVATALPMPVILLDYLYYYPFIDEGTVDDQTLDNTTTPMTRYTDGAGVQIMAVSVAGRTGGQTFNVSYTNQDGVSGRTTTTVIQNTGAVNGTIITSDGALASSAGPFLPLQEGDTGVRSIDTVRMVSGTDVGLFTLVLVKPLLQTQIRGIDAPVETDPFLHKGFTLPVIKDDAFLGLICLPLGSLAATQINGYLKCVWT